MKRIVTLVVLSAMLAGAAMADAKETKASKQGTKTKQECCTEEKGCCSRMKSDKASKSKDEPKVQEKQESATSESK